MKTLIAVIIIAVIILVIAALVSPKQSPAPVVDTQAGAAILTLLSPVGSTVEVGQRQNVTWTSTNYKARTVALNVTRKVGSNPDRFELVRTISPALKNDGTAVWVPAKSDLGANIYLELACAPTEQGCVSARSSGSFAVIAGSRNSNVAALYEASEALENN